MVYHDMELEAFDAAVERNADKSRRGRFKVRVLRSPAGEMKAEEAAAVEYDDKALQKALGELERRSLDRSGLVAMGRLLGLLLLPPKREGAATGVRELLDASLIKVGPQEGLRLRLRLPALLAVIPWEFVYVDRVGGGEGMDGFLALDPRIAVVRHESLAAPANPPLLKGDIKLVAAFASTEGLAPLDVDKERSDLEEALKDQTGLTAHYLPEATLDEILSLLPGAGVFHFAGHGVFTRQMGDIPGTYTGSGALAFEDQAVGAEQLGVNLRGNGVRLAVLGGCESGRRDAVSVWSGIAPALVKAEIPAVVANQYSIRDKCALAFSRQLYRSIVGGLGLERAVVAGRIAAYNAEPDGRDWGVPVLYLRAGDGRLFEGAADSGVRANAAREAEVVAKLRLKEVAKGGFACGAEVKEMLAGKLQADLIVDGVVYGKVVGVRIGTLGGGNVTAAVEVQTVETDGSVTGVIIDKL
ncbi:MAG: CHAT domain-containing protein [Desulfobacterales bacterium]|jgi:hypothetical protein|nr:CHAT domain-containing protein [Desulfobacterales bacterium]